MSHFRRNKASGLQVRLESEEAELMRRLIAEMRSLLEEDARDDPAVKRLFPDAYQSADDARAYRELVGDELRAGKLKALDAMAAVLGKRGAVEQALSPEEARAWLRALTDMRLALGTRLEVTEETMAADVDEDDPNAPMLAVLHWLGWLQESLLQVIDN